MMQRTEALSKAARELSAPRFAHGSAKDRRARRARRAHSAQCRSSSETNRNAAVRFGRTNTARRDDPSSPPPPSANKSDSAARIPSRRGVGEGGVGRGKGSSEVTAVSSCSSTLRVTCEGWTPHTYLRHDDSKTKRPHGSRTGCVN